MAMKKYKLGELIELCDERNSDNQYRLSDVKGISINEGQNNNLLSFCHPERSEGSR